jgi:hypothetical protein
MADLERAAHVEFAAAIPELGARQGPLLTFPLFAPVNLTREYAGRSSRTSDVLTAGPSVVDERRTIHLPPGAQAVDLPPPVTIDSPFLSVDLGFVRQGADVVAHRVLTVKTDRVPLARYPAFRDVCQRVDEALARRATVRLPAGGP